MRNQKKLLIEQLDRKLEPFKGIEVENIPTTGWIKNIRTALNMSLEQLGKKINITKQGVKKIEEREVSGSITIKILKTVGKALGMYFVYGFVAIDDSVENFVDKKAKELAKKVVFRTNQNMKLEDQGNTNEQISSAIEELSAEFKRKMLKSLWD